MNSKHPQSSVLCPATAPRFLVYGAALWLAFPILSGCSQSEGPPRAAVTGSVLLNGLPMPAGVIRFVPQGATVGPQVTATVELGRFDLPSWNGPLVGEHRVEIELRDNGGIAPDDEQTLQRLASLAKKQRPAIHVQRIPECYNRRSELVARIAPEQTNELMFELATGRK